MRLQEYRLTNLNKLALLGKVENLESENLVKVCNHQRRQPRGAMSLVPLKNASKINGDTFKVTPLVFCLLKLTYLSNTYIYIYIYIYIYTYIYILYIYTYITSIYYLTIGQRAGALP